MRGHVFVEAEFTHVCHNLYRLFLLLHENWLGHFPAGQVPLISGQNYFLFSQQKSISLLYTFLLPDLSCKQRYFPLLFLDVLITLVRISNFQRP